MRRQWLRNREDGLLELYHGPGNPGPDWVLVPLDMAGEIGVHPERFGPSSDRKSIVRRVPIRLSLSMPVFASDGTDESSFMVIAADEESKALRDIQVAVNDETVLVQPGEAVPIRTTKPGSFRVRVTDPRVYPIGLHERFAKAVLPENLEEERARVLPRRSIPPLERGDRGQA